MSEMDGEEKGWAWLVSCIAIVLVTLIGCVTYYNIEDNKMEERLIIKALEKGVSPAVLKCVDTTWETIATHGICRQVLTNHNLTREQAAKLVEELK